LALSERKTTPSNHPGKTGVFATLGSLKIDVTRVLIDTKSV